MCIGETRLNDNVTDRDINISGYDLIRNDRTGELVVMYASTSKPNYRTKLEVIS